MRSTYSRAAVVAVGLLASTVSAAFEAAGSKNVAIYWGQGYDQMSLSEVCNDPSVDIVNLGFVNRFPKKNGDYPGTNFANACGSEVYRNPDGTASQLLSNCASIGPAIKECQANGKKVLLSIGGGAPTDYYLPSKEVAKYFAEFLWGAFGPQTNAWTRQGKPRPFGDAVVDGFDLDIESFMDPAPVSNYKYANYEAFVTHLKDTLFPKTGKAYYVSAAPQCIVPDAHLADAISKSKFDFIFVQFYNTPTCSTRAGYNGLGKSSTTFTFDNWVTWLKANSKNKQVKLYLGVLGGEDGTSSDKAAYLEPEEANQLVSFYANKHKDIFGGVMVWEATVAARNQYCSKGYATLVKDILLGKFVKPVCSPTTTPAPQPTGRPTPDGTCGGAKGYTCYGWSLGECCSQWGFCGTGKDWCEVKCQKPFGKCGPQPPVSVTPSNTPPASVTPSNTPPASVTPSNTPPASVTPSNTPPASVTPSDYPASSSPAPSNTPPASVTPSDYPVSSSPAPSSTPPASVTPSNTPPASVTPSDYPVSSSPAPSSPSSDYPVSSTPAPSSDYPTSSPSSDYPASSPSSDYPVSSPSSDYPVSSPSSAAPTSVPYPTGEDSSSDYPSGSSTSCSTSATGYPSSTPSSEIPYPTSEIPYPTSEGPSSEIYPSGSSTSCSTSAQVYPTGSNHTTAVPYPTSSPEVYLPSSSKGEDVTTTITTTYIDICPTGITTVTATITKTICAGCEASPSTYTTVTVCNHCGPKPTTVTLTKPYPAYPTAVVHSTTHTTKVITLTVYPVPVEHTPVPYAPVKSSSSVDVPAEETSTKVYVPPYGSKQPIKAYQPSAEASSTKAYVPSGVAGSTNAYAPSGAASSTGAGSYPTYPPEPLPFEGAASRFSVGMSAVAVLVAGFLVL